MNERSNTSIASPPAPPTTDPVSQGLTVGDLLRLCWGRRRLLIAVFAATVFLTLLVTLRITPLFEARAKLVVNSQPKAMDFTQDPNAGRVELGFLNTERDKILAHPVLTEALRQSKLGKSERYAGSEDPVAALRGRLGVTTSRETWSIDVALRDEDPDQAEEGLAVLLRVYREMQQDLHREGSQGALAFIDQQLSDTHTKLAEQRLEEQRFRREHNILFSDPDNNHLTTRLSEIVAARGALDQEMATSAALMEQVRQAGDDLTALLQIETINLHPLVVEQQKQLYALLDARVPLDSIYKDQHPRMLEINEQIANKRRQLAEVVAQVRQVIAAKHRSLELRAASSDAAIAQAEAALSSYRQDLVVLRELMNKTAATEDIVASLTKRQNEEEINAKIDATKMELIEPAKKDLKPINIKYPLFAAAALFIGLLAGGVAVVVAEMLERRIRGFVGLQAACTLPVICRIPHAIELQTGVVPLAVGEAIRHLRATLRLMRNQRLEQRVLLITSADSSDGKTTIAATLAEAMAGGGDHVLLVDGDMRRPSIHTHFDIATERGFCQLLEGEKVYPLKDVAPGLDVMPVGTPPTNPAELLHGSELTSVLGAWAEDYDQIIIDSPPLGQVADALLLGEVSDSIVLVVRDGSTHKSSLMQAIASLRSLLDRVIGLVFNAEQRNREQPYYTYYMGKREQTAADLPQQTSFFSKRFKADPDDENGA